MGMWKRAAAPVPVVPVDTTPPPIPEPEPGYVLELGGGAFEVVSCDRHEMKQRVRNLGGTIWHHTGEDAHGRWIYRSR